ncbi:adenylyl-sulfate kinase [Streptomyces caatingaensis]|uniref:adenylyl-sulfate kinase n=1 Tax=Streptomyces caatingaensis TaxID=1678637 RepID=UPI0006727F6E|nr:adenylyl-sulfate kinase [Streptomyces caatingaensis]
MLWITGLSGAGKSTVAGILRDRLAAGGVLPVLLDGDRLRATLPVRPGHREEDRRRLARYYGALAGELAAQGHLVICATVSLFHEAHARNRRRLPGYYEVLLRVPLDDLRQRRDRASLYGAPDTRDVVGLGTPAEFPLAPDLVVDNCGDTTAEDAAEAILRGWAGRG